MLQGYRTLIAAGVGVVAVVSEQFLGLKLDVGGITNGVVELAAFVAAAYFRFAATKNLKTGGELK